MSAHAHHAYATKGPRPYELQAVRLKRRSGVKDAISNEAFMRIRGSLFFGPSFLVTRNKLTFRDNLAELLAAAVPGAPGGAALVQSQTALCCLDDGLPPTRGWTTDI